MRNQVSLVALFTVSLAAACSSNPSLKRDGQGYGGNDGSGMAEVGMETAALFDMAVEESADVPAMNLDSGKDASTDVAASMGGAGGAVGTGGAGGAGEVPVLDAALPTGGTGATTAAGGSTDLLGGAGQGGVTIAGGVPGTGGAKTSGGTVGTGGADASGDTPGTGGATALGGSTGTGGTPPMGGATGETPYTLTVSMAGNGSGTVTSDPTGISCGSVCSQTFNPGSTVVLAASAGLGSTFAGWSGGGCSGGGTCRVSMTAASAVTATFTLNQYTLTVSRAGTGGGTVTSNPAGISCGLACAQVYDYPTSVTLTASASTGSTFVGWSGDGCSGAGTCTVAMTAERAVTATFVLDQHTLTVSTAGTGTGVVTSSPAGINCGSTCDHAYGYLTSVTLTANAGTGSAFSGWSGSGCSGTGTCTVSMTSASLVTATFTLSQYTLTVGMAGTGRGTVTSDPAGISCGMTCARAYDYLSSVTLTASANTGSTFGGWSGGGCSGTGDCTVSIVSAGLVTATFTLNQYALTVATAGAGSGTVTSDPAGINCGSTCTHTYGYNTPVYLTAAPNHGWTFKGWSGSGCTGTGICIVQMSDANAVTATFDLLTCNTVSDVFSCYSSTTFPDVNYGPIDATSCHNQCEAALRLAGVTSGCWVSAGNGNCYCRGANMTESPGSTALGGACN